MLTAEEESARQEKARVEKKSSEQTKKLEQALAKTATDDSLIADLKERLKELKQHQQDDPSADALSKAQGDERALRGELQSARQRAETLEVTLTEQRQELEDAQTSMSDTKKAKEDFEKQVSEQSKRADSISSQTSKDQAVIVDLKAQVQEAQRASQMSADKCTTLSRTLAEHTQKEEKLRAEVTAAAHTKAKMAELQEELESARERGQKAEKESLTFKKEMATHRSGKDSALQELAAANAEIAMLKKQLQAERDGAKERDKAPLA